ncbi:hypothetical protein EJ357_18955 [Streptomyces cyaneochromogenes]|uniref:Uncharacterized protein n=1 Tax=Streptomyces cyaneochromogenes TaxID=2496836 RepID=A0A3S9M824_9ACTN|nr:hypothetical protein [Streptomyces cyaneochromogenes]AZQ35312.1 hypothetical protein EJ357_18955 [Streptomyces cyaneochromogenes]
MTENSDHSDRSANPDHPEHSARHGYSEKDVQREVTELEGKSATAARLFDIRRIIGGLFVIYGVIVTIVGLTDDDAAIDKAEGININLWTGLGMLLLGLFFLAWLKLRPTAPPPPDVDAGAAPGGGPTE